MRGGRLADAGVAGQPQALPGQVEGPSAVPGAQFGLGEPAQEVHLALDHAAPPHLAQQRGDGGAGLGELVAHEQPAEAGQPRRRCGDTPPAGPGAPASARLMVAGASGMPHQGLRLRLEGEREEFGAPVTGPRGELRRVRGLLPALREVALDEQGPPGELVADAGRAAGGRRPRRRVPAGRRRRHRPWPAPRSRSRPSRPAPGRRARWPGSAPPWRCPARGPSHRP